MGTLYYGDNLDILRRYLKDETVDLVYLDPPFNSAQNYNAFFQEKDGSAAASQIHAFEDTWHWDIETKKAYDAVTEQAGMLQVLERLLEKRKQHQSAVTPPMDESGSTRREQIHGKSSHPVSVGQTESNLIQPVFQTATLHLATTMTMPLEFISPPSPGVAIVAT
jgi:hypothetical protein